MNLRVPGVSVGLGALMCLYRVLVLYLGINVRVSGVSVRLGHECACTRC